MPDVVMSAVASSPAVSCLPFLTACFFTGTWLACAVHLCLCACKRVCEEVPMCMCVGVHGPGGQR